MVFFSWHKLPPSPPQLEPPSLSARRARSRPMTSRPQSLGEKLMELTERTWDDLNLSSVQFKGPMVGWFDTGDYDNIS